MSDINKLVNKVMNESLILSDISPKLNTTRSDIKIGQKVAVVEKQNQGTDKLTIGKVKRILTSSNQHHRGIKVMLEDGKVGRIQKIL